MMRGRFIVFEGIDGAGKTTQIKLLADHLSANRQKVVVTQEPTDSETGKLLRRALSGDPKLSPSQLASLFTLDRIGHNLNPENGIRVLLDKGFDVICDRYYYSTLAYQGSETNPDWVRSMNLDCPDILHPDLCIFLDLSPEQSMNRILARGESLEIFENLQKLSATRDRFLSIFRSLPDRIEIIDASASVESVHQQILNVL